MYAPKPGCFPFQVPSPRARKARDSTTAPPEPTAKPQLHLRRRAPRASRKDTSSCTALLAQVDAVLAPDFLTEREEAAPGKPRVRADAAAAVGSGQPMRKQLAAAKRPQVAPLKKRQARTREQSAPVDDAGSVSEGKGAESEDERKDARSKRLHRRRRTPSEGKQLDDTDFGDGDDDMSVGGGKHAESDGEGKDAVAERARGRSRAPSEGKHREMDEEDGSARGGKRDEWEGEGKEGWGERPKTPRGRQRRRTPSVKPKPADEDSESLVPADFNVSFIKKRIPVVTIRPESSIDAMTPKQRRILRRHQRAKQRHHSGRVSRCCVFCGPQP